MKTVLLPHGDGYMIEIDRKTVEEWKIDPQTDLEVSVVDGVLTLCPADDPDLARKVDKALKNIMERYDGALKRLAE